jgi:hypothetical protein
LCLFVVTLILELLEWAGLQFARDLRCAVALSGATACVYNDSCATFGLVAVQMECVVVVVVVVKMNVRVNSRGFTLPIIQSQLSELTEVVVKKIRVS